MGADASKEQPQPSSVVNAPQQESSACPVPQAYRNPAIYNVYGQRIDDGSQQGGCPSPLAALQGTDLLDPKNNMPLEPNQQPCPGQRLPLSLARIQSNIPKGGTDTTWLYPSPQMFYNGEQGACCAVRYSVALVGGCWRALLCVQQHAAASLARTVPTSSRRRRNRAW
jgi:cytochrome c heme-lyase